MPAQNIKKPTFQRDDVPDVLEVGDVFGKVPEQEGLYVLCKVRHFPSGQLPVVGKWTRKEGEKEEKDRNILKNVYFKCLWGLGAEILEKDGIMN